MPEPNSSIETAWKVYADATQTIRHYDGERTSTHRVALTVLSVLLAFAGSSLFSQDMLLPVCVLGGVMTIVFAAISVKFGSLIDRERARARAARETMAQLGDSTIKDIDVQRTAAKKRQILGQWRLSTMWFVYYFVALLGFVALCVSHYLR